MNFLVYVLTYCDDRIRVMVAEAESEIEASENVVNELLRIPIHAENDFEILEVRKEDEGNDD